MKKDLKGNPPRVFIGDVNIGDVNIDENNDLK